eukprot:CAMPEP_0197176316 /NCGR_PEP_ID=MMETSP1423-20130617/2289_1 /TAXON_ID=476441 /ORGANISM="Pseudo-nitzschia heimii, Strain UNC1101" /LENGTH=285 /DNA_ID=CAMNT_0042625683 /DNA_START=294 /DNA_END=1152 /DNA_ORIENTATION=-
MAKITCLAILLGRPAFVLLLLMLQCHRTCQSFQLSPLLSPRSSALPPSIPISLSSRTSLSQNRRYSSQPHYYTDPSTSNVHDQTPPPPSFEQRMREQLQRHQLNQRSNRPTPSSSSNQLVTDVRNLQEYKKVLDQTGKDDQMLAVLWYSPWCKACRATIPGIRTLAKRHPNVKFIQVPVLEENANLHQGLDVPSVPYLHLYVPDDPRLVEEKKMTRKRLSGFQKLLCDYEQGHCSLERDPPVGESDKMGEKKWSTSNPYLVSFDSSAPPPNFPETKMAGIDLRAP